MKARNILSLTFALGLLGGCTADPKNVDDVLGDFSAHAGKRILLKTKLRSGARCRIGDEEGQWKTYCKGDECQYCSGPVVVASNVKPSSAGLDDWPMILGGIHEGKPFKCKGPLNKVSCGPFDLDKTYVLRGIIEKHHPPRLMVTDFWEADE